MSVVGPALAMFEIADVPLGLRALDAIVKEAPVEVVATGTVQNGRYLVGFRGEVEAVERSFSRAQQLASARVIDRVLLAHAESRIVPAFRDGAVRWPAPGDTLGVVQTTSCPTLLRAIDAALKGAEVDLVELRLADGLGGRAIATMWGGIHDVQAAIELACAAIGRHREHTALAGDESTTAVIPNADEEVMRAIGCGTRFFKEWRG